MPAMPQLYSTTEEVVSLFKDFRKIEGERTKLYLGVELEVNALDVKFNGMLKACMRVRESLGNHIVIKPEGVYNGFEIVTLPATLRYHREKLWNGFFADANTYLGGDKGCGMHVHFSRDAVDDKTLAKVIVFYHEPLNNRFMSEIAGRDVSPEVQWCRSIKKTYEPSDPSKTIYEATPGAMHPQFPGVQLGRGSICISTRKEGRTVEVRIFQSTPTLEEVMANIEYVVAVIDWCKQIEMKEADIRVGNFITWFVTENRKLKFPYLHDKLVKLNYINYLIAGSDDIRLMTHTRAREDVA